MLWGPISPWSPGGERRGPSSPRWRRRTPPSTRSCARAGACPSRSACSGTCRRCPRCPGRARAPWAAPREWAVPPTCVEGAPVGRTGLAGIHVVAARGASRPVAEGDRVYGRVVETPSARLLGLADVGRRAAGRLAPGPAEDAGGGDRRGLGAARAGGVLLPRRGAHLVLPPRHPRLVRSLQRGPQRRVPPDGPHGPGRGRPDPGQHGDRGAQSPRRLVHARPPRARAPRRGPGRDAAPPQPPAERGDRVRLGVRPGMEVVLGDARYVFVSGTASIDDHGATVHVGDFETQTRYTLEAVEALLEGAGARLSRHRPRRRPSSTNPCDGRAFERIVERSDLREAPLVTTVADVCRDDLLFEIDAIAVVPLAPRGAAVKASAGAGPRPRPGRRAEAGAGRAAGAAVGRRRADRGGPGAGRGSGPGGARRRNPSSGAGRGGRLVLVPRRAAAASSPPPSTAPPTPTCPSTGSDPLRRRRRRTPIPGASGR